MKLFDKKIADDLSYKVQGLVDDFSETLSDYEFVSEKIDRRDELADYLYSSAGLTLVATLPVGMLIGASYMGGMGNGGLIGSILPASIGIGAGLISYLNHRTNKDLVSNPDLDKPMQSLYNEKHGQEFLKKLGELDVGEAFKSTSPSRKHCE